MLLSLRVQLKDPGKKDDVVMTDTASIIRDEHFEPPSDLDLDRAIASGDLTAIHHLLRYAWAEDVLRCSQPSGPILDLGCGAGYGSFTLAAALPDLSVLGVDYDPKAIATAQQRYKRPNLTYRVGNPLSWGATIGTREFHTIMLFDVLEHVEHRELLLEEVVTHLSQDGQLFLSTPCGAASNDLKPEWEFHRIEYSAASLFDFLSRYFAAIARPEDSGFPSRAIFESALERGVHYLLRMNPVICRRPRVLPNPYRA